MTATVERMLNIPILSACGIDDHDHIERLSDRMQFKSGEVILQEGQVDRALWLLISGTCEVIKRGHQQEDQQLAILEAGSVFGEMSFLHPAPHSASVKALTRVEIAKITPNAFEALRKESPAAAYCVLTHLVQLLSDRLRRMDERICEELEESPAERQQEWHDFRARLFAGDYN
ncbi:MAG: Crp/Fnr family transcriptional regulator [Planctomycetaceae bacterium]